MRQQLTRETILERLGNERGKRLVVLPWWRDAFHALDDPAMREVILWLMRQAGKSQFLAADAAVVLLTVPGSYSVFVSASETQAGAIYTRKLRRPLERLMRALGMADAVRFTKRGLEYRETGAALEIIAPNEATAPARSIDGRLYFDEARDIPDAVYEALVPSVIGGGGTVVIASTAGRPRGFFHELVRNPTPETWVYHSAANENPHASGGVVDFLRRRLGIISPASARRELGNEFAEDGDEFLQAGLIAAAVDDGLGEVPSSVLPAFAFLDLSRRRDLTSLVVVLRDAPRRPEAADHLVAASVQVFDPRQSPSGEIDFRDVRAALVRLRRRFPGLARLLVDEGAEAGAVLPFARASADLSLIVKGFVATPESNMQLWGALAARFHGGTLSIPRHERLLAELRGLRQESFTLGSRWRVVDSSRKLHRDVSLALAGAVFAADEHAPRRCDVPGCGDTSCSGLHALDLLSGTWDTGYSSRSLPPAPSVPDPWESAVEPTWAPPAPDPELSTVVGLAVEPDRTAAAVLMTRDAVDDLAVLLRHHRGPLADAERALASWRREFRVEGVYATGAAEPFPYALHELAAALREAGLAVEILGDGPAARAWGQLQERLGAGRIVLYAAPAVREQTMQRALALGVAACGVVLVEETPR